MQYKAVFCLLVSFPGYVQADDMKLRYFLSEPVVEPMAFNGIEGRAVYAIVPPDDIRPLSPEQNSLLTEYRALEDQCRGGRPGPETDKACERRDTMNLRKSGICFGLKKDQSIADMAWHSCSVSSNEYEVGSENLGLSCRPGESLSLMLGIQRPEGLSEVVSGKGLVKVAQTALKAAYSSNNTVTDDGDRIMIVYDFDSSGVTLLREIYDGSSVSFPVGSGSTLNLAGDMDQSFRDEIARAYSICK